MVHAVMFVSAISPVHVGAGEGLGIIDRPVMRERTTNYPIVPGSTLKGVLRDEYKPEVANKLFGQMDDGSKHAGCVSFSDASIFAFPIRSLKGSFVWATSPLVLYRLQRIIELADLTSSFPKLTGLVKKRELHSDTKSVFINPKAKDTLLIAAPSASVGDRIILEEFTLTVNMQLTELEEFASEVGTFIFASEETFRAEFIKKLVIIPEDRFNYFVTYATEVTPNIRINDATGTSTEGLRYSEYLPAETILYSLASFDKSLAEGNSEEFNDEKKVRHYIVTNRPKNAIQIGADGTKGKGFVKVNFVSGGKK